MKFPTYIVVEGPDCSGKSTLVAALAIKLEDLGYSVYRAREPYASTKREMVGKTNKEATILMRLDRLDIMGNYLSYAESSGDFIIADRNYNSEAAYQGETKAQILDILEFNRQWFIVPDLTVFLEVARSEASAICYSRSEAFSPTEFDRLVKNYHFIQGQTTTPKMTFGPAWSVEERVQYIMEKLEI